MAALAPLSWTEPALDDLDEIAAWIARDDERAAALLVHRVMTALRRFPALGRRVPEMGGDIYRELVVPPCRIIYRRAGARIVIVYVLRGERPLRANRLL